MMTTRKFTGMELLNFWQLYRAGKSRKEIMQLMKLTDEESIDISDQAQQVYGYGPRTLKQMPVIEQGKAKPFTRPPAKYDNMQPEDYERKYLND